MTIRVLGALQTSPPLDAGNSFGYLTSDGAAQNLLPYTPGVKPGDVMFGFLPWLCQSGYYGDAFDKFSNVTVGSETDGETLFRFLDGTEGTVPGGGKIVNGLTGAEYGRPQTDLITGVSLRGANKTAGVSFPLKQSKPTSTNLGNGTYRFSSTVSSFTVTVPTLVLAASYGRGIDFDSGNPDYIPYEATFVRDTAQLDLVSESVVTGPDFVGGWRVQARLYPAGATVPAVTESFVSNSIDSVGPWLMVACLAQGTSINSVTNSSGTLTVSGDRARGATISASSPGLSFGSVSYPDADTWQVTATGYGGGSVTISATDGTNPAAYVFPDPTPSAIPSPGPGMYPSAQSVTFTTNKDARVLYTLDGSSPTISSRASKTRTSGGGQIACSSTPYYFGEPISVPTGTTLKTVTTDDLGASASQSFVYANSRSSVTDTTSSTESNSCEVKSPAFASVTDASSCADSNACLLHVAATVSAPFLIAASFLLAVLYDTANADVGTTSDAVAISQRSTNTDATVVGDDVGIGIAVVTSDATSQADASTVALGRYGAATDSSTTSDAVGATLVYASDATDATSQTEAVEVTQLFPASVDVSDTTTTQDATRTLAAIGQSDESTSADAAFAYVGAIATASDSTVTIETVAASVAAAPPPDVNPIAAVADAARVGVLADPAVVGVEATPERVGILWRTP